MFHVRGRQTKENDELKTNQGIFDKMNSHSLKKKKKSMLWSINDDSMKYKHLSV